MVKGDGTTPPPSWVTFFFVGQDKPNTIYFPGGINDLKAPSKHGGILECYPSELQIPGRDGRGVLSPNTCGSAEIFR